MLYLTFVLCFSCTLSNAFTDQSDENLIQQVNELIQKENLNILQEIEQIRQENQQILQEYQQVIKENDIIQQENSDLRTRMELFTENDLSSTWKNNGIF